MEQIFNKHSIVVINIKQKTQRCEIRAKLAQFGEIVKLTTLPMKNSSGMMSFCKFNDNLSMINAIRKSRQVEINNNYPIIRKAFDKLNLDEADNIKITIKNNNNHKSKCICIQCIQNHVKSIKGNVNELESLIVRINKDQISKQQYTLLLRLIEMKDTFRNLLNFFSHEKVNNHIFVNQYNSLKYDCHSKCGNVTED